MRLQFKYSIEIVEKRYLRYLLPLSIAVLAFLAYGNSFPGAFILDDHMIVENNPLVARLDLSNIFLNDYWGSGENSGLYRPLTILSLSLNRLFLGPQPFGYHVVNVLLHSSVALLLLTLLRRWNFSLPVAWLAAGIFAVHPIHTEVVNEIVGRSELLVALLLLLAFIFAEGCSLGRGIAVCCCYLLALLAKEHAIVFILLLPLVEYYRAEEGRRWRERWRLYAALILITVAWLLWRHYGVIRLDEPEIYDPLYAPLAYTAAATRIATALKLQWVYLYKQFIPWPLQAIYSGPSYPGLTGVFSIRGGVSILSFLLVAAGVWYGWRCRYPLALFATLYAISFAPTSQLLFPIGAPFAERFAYLPSLWFCCALAVIVDLPRLAQYRRWLLVLALLFLSSLLALTLCRNRDFASELRLWQADVGHDPQNIVAWQALGETLTGEGRYSEAEQAFRKALELKPDSAVTLHIWANYLLKTGRYQEAIAAAQRSMSQQLIRNDQMRAQGNMGVMVQAYIELGDFAEARLWLDRGARFSDPEIMLPAMQGRVYAGLGRYQEAVAEFEKIPGWRLTRDMALSFGNSLMHLGRLDEAGDVLEQGLNEPNNAALWNTLGVVRSRQGRTLEAISAFQRAVAQQPENRHYQENLSRIMSRQAVDPEH